MLVLPQHLAREAHSFAELLHRGQERANGDRYITHPEAVAARIMNYPMHSEEMVAAGCLHDCVEDVLVFRSGAIDIGMAIIQHIFGYRVAKLVDDLTNRPHGENTSRAECKMFDRLRLAKVSPEAKFIKLIDRIDNLRDIGAKGEWFAKIYRQESLLLLNECLRGINAELEKELEDLCLEK